MKLTLPSNMVPSRLNNESQSSNGSNVDGSRRIIITHLSMDEDTSNLIDHDDAPRCQDHSTHHDFLRHVIKTSGPPQIIALCLIIALALGSTIGVVPSVVEDRYARLRHGYHGNISCLDIAKSERPTECLLGNEDAQNSAAISGCISNMLTFATSSLMGSISDEKGRRGIMLIGIGLSLLAPLNLVLLQIYPTLDPFLYYASHAASGAISWLAVALSAISDVMPPVWRAPSFGLVLAGFNMGFAFSPILAVFLSHFAVSIFALGILVLGFLFTCISMPETLSPEAARRATLNRMSSMPIMNTRLELWKYKAMRPLNDMLILNRNLLFRLLSALAFFSGCISTADHTLFLYYVEENLGFNDRDIAVLFLMLGLTGIIIQAVILKWLNDIIGERRVIMIAFFFGALHNYLYGVAQSKTTIFIAASIASFTGMSFPTISAIKANNVDESEQGRIQGALYSLSSLASAIGPMMLRYVYHRTKDGGGFGKGTMFVFGSGLYLLATFCAYMLPTDQANSKHGKDDVVKKSNVLLRYGSTESLGHSSS